MAYPNRVAVTQNLYPNLTGLLLINCLQPCLLKYGTIDLSMLTVCSGSIAANTAYFSINSLTLLNLSLESRVELSVR